MRNNFLNLDDSWNLNKLLLDSLDLVDFRHNNWSIHNLFNDLLSSNDFCDYIMNWNDFLNYPLYFIYLSSNIRNLFNNFFDFCIADNLLFGSHNFNRLRLNSVFNNYFFCEVCGFVIGLIFLGRQKSAVEIPKLSCLY